MSASHRRLMAVLLVAATVASAACGSRSTLSDRMSDQEFWSMVNGLSEPPGTFAVSDNLVSNEPHVGENARWLRPRGGVYIGVGPEQNFSYIASLEPAMAFIIDIRRENRALHFLYKALFELSADRVDFVSRLFSRRRPGGLEAGASVEHIFSRYAAVAPSPALFEANARLVREHLLTTRHLPLPEDDLEWIDRVLRSFYADGPEIQFWGSRSVDANRPSYRELMTSKDFTGQPRSFLATEQRFAVVRDLQMRNKIVPLVGDFGGVRTMRGVAEYLRSHHTAVQAFYASNVSVYLTQRQAQVFCGNLGTLPAASDAWFIESVGVRPLAAKLKACAPATRKP